MASASAGDVDVDAGPTMKVCLLIGGTGGLGKAAAALMVANGGWDVYITGRNLKRAEAAAEVVNKEAGVEKQATGHSGSPKGRCHGAGPLDLGALANVRTFAEAWLATGRPTHTLLLNAGAMTPGSERVLTSDGIEATVATNHLALFLLTRLLLPKLRETPGRTRVVTVGSFTHDPEAPLSPKGQNLDFADLERAKDGAYAPLVQYASTKIMNMMFAFELDRRLKAEGARVMAVCFHPGFVPASDFMRHMKPCALCCIRCSDKCCCHACGRIQTLDQGAGAEAYAATSEELEGGEYLDFRCKRVGTTAHAADTAAWKQLWEWSEERLGVDKAPADKASP